jgi:hypothetical protein
VRQPESWRTEIAKLAALAHRTADRADSENDEASEEHAEREWYPGWYGPKVGIVQIGHAGEERISEDEQSGDPYD